MNIYIDTALICFTAGIFFALGVGAVMKVEAWLDWHKHDRIIGK